MRAGHTWSRTTQKASIRFAQTVILAYLAGAGSFAQGQTWWYVDKNSADPTHDGSSWCDAFTDLQDALALAWEGDIIRVADGTYAPVPCASPPCSFTFESPERGVSFQLINGLEVYGGYAGCGAPDPDERDPSTYVTILSGDINVDDAGDLDDPSRDENSYHVVDASYTDWPPILEGFTVTGGNANGSGPVFDMFDVGGGILVIAGNPTLSDCTFSGNQAIWGGGVGNWPYSSPWIEVCTFTGNRAEFGGGIHNEDNSHPWIFGCTFTDNDAGDGGGMHTVFGSHATVVWSSFIGNTAGLGGAMANGWSDVTVANTYFLGNSASEGGGAIWNKGDHAPMFINCALSGNTSGEDGGAIYNQDDTSPTLSGCTLSHNEAPSGDGGGVYHASSGGVTVMNGVLWGNADSGGTDESAQVYLDTGAGGTAAVNRSVVQGGWSGDGGVGIVASDPLFIDADGDDNTYGTADDNLRLQSTSPAIDAGDSTAVPADSTDVDGDYNTTEPLPRDLDSLRRLLDDPDTADTGVPLYTRVVDMGAYEFADCNDNGTTDGQDIEDGTGFETDGDGQLDECAGEVLWNNAGGGFFDVGGNWSGGTTPTPFESAVFDLSSGGYTVEFSTDEVTHYLAIRNDIITLDLSGFTYLIDNLFNMGEDAGQSAQLTVNNGTLLSQGQFCSIGSAFGSSGEVVVDGPGAVWASGGWFDIGSGGDGTLTISNGGQATCGGATLGEWNDPVTATGHVLVTGTGSAWTSNDLIIVGLYGSGIAEVRSGAAVASSGSLWVGTFEGASGEVTINGTGSTWVANDAVIGDWGEGTLRIEAGGTLTCYEGGQIGSLPTAVGDATVTGTDSSWNLSDEPLWVGNEGQGTLSIEDGGSVQNDWASVGQGADSVGHVTVTGSGSTWTVTDWLDVGVAGQGTLDIEDGGIVEADAVGLGIDVGSVGETTVTGAGSTCILTGGLDVGKSGQGTLDVDNGGSVSAVGATLGREAGSVGEVTITGSGSTLTLDDWFEAGYSGQGTLNIQNGGSAENDWALVGRDAGAVGEVTVTGSGSTWMSTGSVTIAEWGVGTLTVSDGGLATTADWLSVGIGPEGHGTVLVENGGSLESSVGGIGTILDGFGEVTVRGAGSAWTIETSLLVGSEGTGTLLIENGANVDCVSVGIGTVTDADGEVVITGAGSTLNWSGSFGIGSDIGGGVGTSGAGTLTVADGGAALGGMRYQIGPGGQVWGDGTLAGGVAVNLGGEVHPGLSAGLLTFDSHFTQTPTGSLFIELGGTLPGSGYDQLEVSGDATLNGLLDISLIQGLTPQLDDRFEIIASDRRLGKFDAVTGLDLGGIKTFETEYRSDGLALVVTETTGVTVEPDPAEVYIDHTAKLIAYAELDNGGRTNASAAVGWLSDDEGVATVGADGTVTGHSLGATTIRAGFQGFEGSVPITVLDIPSLSEPLTERVSVSSAGVEGDADATVTNSPALSADGRYVAFVSAATNLVADDTNNVADIFLHDRDTGVTTRISVSTAGDEGNGTVVTVDAGPVMSADGLHIVFVSEADNLVASDGNGALDVFAHDVTSGTTTRMSIKSGGVEGDSNSAEPAITTDGRFVAFSSHSTNLVDGDTNGMKDVFVHDRDPDENSIFDEGNGVTVRVSLSSGGAETDGDSDYASISSEGRFVSFVSDATNLVVDDSNNVRDVFVHDRDPDENGVYDEANGITTRVSVGTGGGEGDDASYAARMSGDGGLVVFASYAGNLVLNDTNEVRDIFMHDRETGATTRVSLSEYGEQLNGPAFRPGLSRNGWLLTFYSQATNVIPGETNGFRQVYVRNLATGGNQLISVNWTGSPGNAESSFASHPAISDDGRVVAFTSEASNLVFYDTNDAIDVFVRDLGPLESDCNENFAADEVDIASGFSEDCNENGIPDECEIDPAGGAPGGPYYCTADCDPDCNNNGIPDACDIAGCLPDNPDYPNCDDCNLNGIPDSCDISALTSSDADLDGVPDECIAWDDEGGDNDWSTAANWEDNVVPDNFGVDVYYVTISGSIVDLNMPVTINALRLLDGATLSVTGTTDEDLTIATDGGLFIQGDLETNTSTSLRIGANRTIDVSAGPVIIGPVGRYEGADMPASAALLAGSVTMRKGGCNCPPACDCDPDVEGAFMQLTGSMSVGVSGDFVLDGADVPICSCDCDPLRGGIAPPPKLWMYQDSQVDVAGSFIIDGIVSLALPDLGGDPALAMALGGDFVNGSQYPSLFDWSAGTLTITDLGGPPQDQLFEVAGRDFGPVNEGFIGNFSMDTIEVAAGQELTFVDPADNDREGQIDPEALYVDTLILRSDARAGASVIIDECKVYYHHLIEEPGTSITAIGSGELVAVTPVEPLPAGGEHAVPKNRYVSFDPNNGEVIAAYELEMITSAYFPESPAVLGWIGEPIEAPEDPGVWIARVADTAFYTDDWPAVVHVGDCAIVPVATYAISATVDGVMFSDPLVIETIAEPTPKYWADCVGGFGGGGWSPPNTVVNMDDVVAAVQKFKKLDTAPHLTWMDIDPEIPNAVLNFADIQMIVQGFKAAPYPFSDPADCP